MTTPPIITPANDRTNMAGSGKLFVLLCTACEIEEGDVRIVERGPSEVTDFNEAETEDVLYDQIIKSIYKTEEFLLIRRYRDNEVIKVEPVVRPINVIIPCNGKCVLLTCVKAISTKEHRRRLCNVCFCRVERHRRVIKSY